MPSLNYSPWGQASDTAMGVNASMNQVAMGIARLRYMQGLQQQRNAIALGQLAVRQHLAEQQGAHYAAQTKESQARTALDQGKLEAAGQLEQGYRNLYRPDMSQGPTIGNAAQITMADIAGPAARSAGLGNEAYRLLLPHNVQENAIAVNPVSGAEIARGPVQIAPGHMYQMPGEQAVINPQQPRPTGNEYKYAPGYGIYSGQTGDIKYPAPTGLKFTDAARIVESPNFIMLPPEIRAFVQSSLTNSPGISQGATDPNKPGATNKAAGASSGKIRKYNPATDDFE